MADVPASYSSTSYYGGRNDGRGAPSTHGVRSGDPSYDRGTHSSYGAPDNYGRAGASYAQPDPWTPAPGSYPTDTDQPSSGSTRTRRREVRQRGLNGWLALGVLLVIAGVGGLIDMISGSTVRGGFNIALVVASIVAIIVVRHRDMFPIVVAPPLVYVAASGVMLYIRSDHLHNRKIIIDAAANWLVYGFPAIAGASAAVLIIAGIRLVLGK